MLLCPGKLPSDDPPTFTPEGKNVPSSSIGSAPSMTDERSSSTPESMRSNDETMAVIVCVRSFTFFAIIFK